MLFRSLSTNKEKAVRELRDRPQRLLCADIHDALADAAFKRHDYVTMNKHLHLSDEIHRNHEVVERQQREYSRAKIEARRRGEL